MPWNSGTYTVPITFVPNTPATAQDQNTQDADIAAGITNCLAIDGQNAAVGNINLGGNKILNLANGVAATDAAAFGQLSAFLPPGIVLPYAGITAPPTGYLLCNGQLVSRITYAGLFAVIGTTYGTGDGVTNFGVPNLTGRVIAGPDPSGINLTNGVIVPDPGTIGAVGGNELITLNLSQIPTHNHGVTVTDPGHSHTYTEAIATFPGSVGGGPGTITTATSGISTSTNTTGITATTALIGGGAGHFNVQPTMILWYLIKT